MNNWTPVTPKAQWAEFEKAMTRGIFERVDSYRRRADLTVEELCRLLDQAGWPVTVSTMNGMLQGKRASVSIAEVFTLARVLEVPPIGLIAPIEKNEEFSAWPDGPAEMTAYDVASWVVGRHIYWRKPEASRRWSPTFMMLERADSYAKGIRRRNADIIARQQNKLPISSELRELRQSLTDLGEVLRSLQVYEANPPRLPDALTEFIRDALPRLRSGNLSDEEAFPIQGLSTGAEIEAAVNHLEREIGARSDFDPALYSDLTLVVNPDGSASTSDQ